MNEKLNFVFRKTVFEIHRNQLYNKIINTLRGGNMKMKGKSNLIDTRLTYFIIKRKIKKNMSNIEFNSFQDTYQ